MERNKAYLALETIGWGRYNMKVFIICGLVKFIQAWLSYDSWLLNIAYTLQGIHEEWGVPTYLLGVFGALYQIGLLLGNIAWGFISDKKGRKLPYRMTTSLALLAGVGLTFSVSPGMVAACLFFMGFCMSGELSLTGSVLFEFCPPKNRYVLTLLSLFLSFGAITSTVVSLMIEYLNTTSISNWRMISGILCIIQFFIAVIRFSLEETPAYLCGKQRFEDAEVVLNKISEANRKKPFQFNENTSILTEQNELSSLGQKESMLTVLEENPPLLRILKQIFGHKLRMTTINLSIVTNIQGLCFVTLTFSGLTTFMPEFLSFLPKGQAYIVMVVQQVVGIPGVTIGTWMVETRLGRRWTTFIGFLGSGIVCFAFYFLREFYLVVANSAVLYFFTYLGYAAIFTIGPESFPTQVRSSGYGLVSIFSRCGGIAGPLLAGLMLSTSGGFLIIICIFAFLYASSGVFIMFLKETRPQNKSTKV